MDNSLRSPGPYKKQTTSEYILMQITKINEKIKIKSKFNNR